MSPPPLKKRKTSLHKTFKNELNRLEEKISQSHELMMSDFKKNVNDLKSTIKRNLSENVSKYYLLNLNRCCPKLGTGSAITTVAATKIAMVAQII